MTGDFSSPIEGALGPGAASAVTRLGNPRPAALPPEVEQHLARIRRKLPKSAPHWNENADFQYTTQFDYRAYAYLRAFAASVDVPDIEPPKRAPDQLVSGKTFRHVMGELQYSMLSRGRPPYPQRRVETGKVRPFSEKEDPVFHRSFVRVCESRKTSFPHLILHGDNCGSWIPVSFGRPFTLKKLQTGDHVVGSSVHLLEELNRLAVPLRMERDWAQQDRGTTAAKEGDPLGAVKYGWAVLRACARLSVEQGVPVIFDG